MLAATNIVHAIARKTVLSHIDIAIRPGELVALLGENGAGKSTLLKVLSGDIRPKTGTVDLNGKPMFLSSLAERARVRAVLPQDGNVAFGFSALETVLFGRHPHCGGAPGLRDRNIAREVMALVDTAHLENRLVATLSGGERARVMLARALAQIWEPWREQPRYLLLDEPVASLDLAHQHAALGVARDFATQRGVGVLAIVHDLNLAAQYADRALVLKRGVVAASGEPREVLTAATIAECFDTEALVLPHPRLDCPLIVPLASTARTHPACP